jgi:lysophospholipase L1-like esterase
MDFCEFDCPPPTGGCWMFPDLDVSRNEEYGEEYSRVYFAASGLCTALIEPSGQVKLVDRTQGYDGNVLAESDIQFWPPEESFIPYGNTVVLDDNYPRAQSVEVVASFTFHAPAGFVWTECSTAGGVWRAVLHCFGLGGDILVAEWTSHPRQTGVKQPWRYLALGDSYASGQGVGFYSPGACYRSFRSYPYLIRNVKAQQGRGISSFNLAACGGAVTSDILSKQITGPNALLHWVTISIGGNDLGFETLIENCVRNDCSNLVITDAQLTDLGNKLATVYRQVLQWTPNARHMVVLYPQIVPPTVTNTCPYGIEQNEANAMRAAWTRANNKIKEVALAQQWEVLDAMATAFDSHSICDSPAYANGVVPTDTRESYHPNAAGHQHMANLLLQSGTVPD